MKRFSLALAIAAITVGTSFVSVQPAEAKSISELAQSALNAVRRQTNPTTGYGNLYGNTYGYPYGYPYGTAVQPPQNESWLSRLGGRYLGTGQTGQYTYNPYTGQYITNPNYGGGTSFTSGVRGTIVRQIINRIF